MAKVLETRDDGSFFYIFLLLSMQPWEQFVQKIRVFIFSQLLTHFIHNSRRMFFKAWFGMKSL
jgi:hypothetical protein